MRLVAAVGFLMTLALLACVRLYAEPPKRVEAVGHFGSLKFGGDEGYEDDSSAYGFTVTGAFRPRWAIEVDSVWGHRESFDAQGLGRKSTRNITSIHIAYRRGSERAYWFGGVGPGFQRDRSRGRTLFQNPGDPSPVVIDVTASDIRFAALGYKTGVVFAPAKHVIIRGEVLFQHAFVLPNVMARIGVGIRF
jgi:hypothetical protein